MSERCSRMSCSGELLGMGSGELKSRPGSASLWSTRKELVGVKKGELLWPCSWHWEITTVLEGSSDLVNCPQSGWQAALTPPSLRANTPSFAFPVSLFNSDVFHLSNIFTQAPTKKKKKLWARDLHHAFWPPVKTNHIFICHPPRPLCAKSLQCPTCCDPVDCNPPGSSVHGFPG